MKNSIFFTCASILISSCAIAQVGINNTAPAASLDITAKNASGSTANVEGLLIPRVDRQRAQSMTGIPVSTMIYVNSIATGTAAGTAVNIDAVGYYFYNGTVWTKLQTPSVNIYNSDGSLTGNRVVTQGSNTLAFTGSTVNAFSVDNGTLSVDAANHRIGIGTGTGTGTPFAKLHVNGNQFMNAALTGSISKDAMDINIGQDGFGYGNRTDNYGINMRSLSSVAGGSIARINFGDNNPTTATGFKYLSFSVGNPTLTELMYLTSANNGTIGVATNTPQRTFHVNGSFQLVGEFNVGGTATVAGSAGNVGQILTSNGAGTAPSWQTAPLSTSVNVYNTDGTLTGNRTVGQGANTLAFTGTAVNSFSVDGNTLSVDALNNRIGIGTTTPAAQLHTTGALRFQNLSTLPANTSSSGLVINANGDIYQNNTVSVEGQIIRIGIDAGTYTTAEAPLRFGSNDSAAEMGPAPNGAPNFINTIVGATITDNVSLAIGTGSPARISDQITLQPGIYKVQVRLSGNFAAASANNLIFIKGIVNNNEYSLINVSNPGSQISTYYYDDYINITGSPQTVDFTLFPSGNNFTVASATAIGGGNSDRSLILIQRLR